MFFAKPTVTDDASIMAVDIFCNALKLMINKRFQPSKISAGIFLILLLEIIRHWDICNLSIVFICNTLCNNLKTNWLACADIIYA